MEITIVIESIPTFVVFGVVGIGVVGAVIMLGITLNMWKLIPEIERLAQKKHRPQI